MIYVAAIFIIAIVGFVVAYPLWKKSPTSKVAGSAPNEELLAQKEATYAALKELEFDYALGNLTPQDHAELEIKYKDKAVSILKQLDARESKRAKPHSAVDEIEAEVLRLRSSAKKAQPDRKAIEDEILKLRQKRPAVPAKAKETCPKCHSEITHGAKFCPYCGSSLEPTVCPKCSANYRQGEKFCAQCGTALPEVKVK
ncbi:MAG: zinc-ribbon protein [Dehalococcoidia bacterium]|nr:zinc-ribbon protein [Dehalococcoidia bacterium]